MRAVTLSLAVVLGLPALATSVQAQSAAPPASQRDADMIGQAPAAAPREARDSTSLSGVILESPQTQKKTGTVHGKPYKAAPHMSSAPVITSGAFGMSYDPRLGPYMVSSLAAQRHRAKKAADLINTGRCPDALQAVFNEGDQYLAFRVAQVCNLPTPIPRLTN